LLASGRCRNFALAPLLLTFASGLLTLARSRLWSRLGVAFLVLAALSLSRLSVGLFPLALLRPLLPLLALPLSR
jgi:hypothetical protein